MSEEDNHIFYNVLPAEKSGGPLSNSTKKSTVTKSAVSVDSTMTDTIMPTPSKSSSMKNKKIMLFIGGGVVLLAIIGGAGYFILKNRSNTPTPTPTTEEPEANDNQQLEGVTTPADWQKRYFGSEVCQTIQLCGDESDPDRDGLKNIDEQKLNTDPNNPDSSGSGIADGDKVNIFGGDPLKSKTKPGDYNDVDYYKNGYDINTDQPFTPERLQEIKDKIKTLGLHQPTIKTFGEDGLKLYDFTDPDAKNEDPLNALNIDQSAGAKLDRDTQRSSTIKKIGSALVKYKKDHSSYPADSEFVQMTETIKPYILIATNFNDPINLDKYIYGYVPGNKNQEFALTYYSETQNQLIKYRSQDAEIDEGKNNSKALDDQRRADLENIKTALLLYSSRNIDAQSTQQYVFPTNEKYKTVLIPDFLTTLPKDPRTKKDYDYQVNETFDTFTLKAGLDNPSTGTTGYLCNQEECKNY